MSGDTSIEWTNAMPGYTGRVWNPTVGCKRVSAGCDHCYAFQLHDQRYVAWKRGRWPSAPEQYHQPFSKIQLLHDRINDPLRWRKPSFVFVNSMSDLFHEDVPGEFINLVWNTMFNAKQHIFTILTKRPERLLQWTKTKAAYTHWPIEDIWPSWMWIGTSVENQKAADERIPLLLQTPAAVRFLSCEPLLGPVNLEPFLVHYDRHSEPIAPRRELNWVIVGGESGPHFRPMNIDWARSLRDQCYEADVAFFYKQFGGRTPKAGGRELDGRTWDEMPEVRR